MAGKELKNYSVTQFNVPCAFNGEASEVTIFLGQPEAKHNPIFFQTKFIQDVKGGVIPSSVLESLEKLQNLATQNGVPFQELCSYALSNLADHQDGETSTSNNNAAIVEEDNNISNEEDLNNSGGDEDLNSSLNNGSTDDNFNINE